jgi:hypothetical protein
MCSLKSFLGCRKFLMVLIVFLIVYDANSDRTQLEDGSHGRMQWATSDGQWKETENSIRISRL